MLSYFQLSVTLHCLSCLFVRGEDSIVIGLCCGQQLLPASPPPWPLRPVIDWDYIRKLSTTKHHISLPENTILLLYLYNPMSTETPSVSLAGDDDGALDGALDGANVVRLVVFGGRVAGCDGGGGRRA